MEHSDSGQTPEDSGGVDEKKGLTWPRWFAWLLVGVLAAGLFIYLTEDKADAAVMECSSVCPEIKDKHRKAAKMYRDGETGRSNGFRPAKVFHNPADAKDIWARKIGAVLKEEAESAAVATGMSPKAVLTATATPAAAFAAGLVPANDATLLGLSSSATMIPPEGECQNWRCSGARSYNRLTDHAGCVDLDPAAFPPNKQSCVPSDWTLFTNEEVREGGEVVKCGAEIVIAVGTKSTKFAGLIVGIVGWDCTMAIWDVTD